MTVKHVKLFNVWGCAEIFPRIHAISPKDENNFRKNSRYDNYFNFSVEDSNKAINVQSTVITFGLTSEPSIKSLNSLNVHRGPTKTVL